MTIFGAALRAMGVSKKRAKALMMVFGGGMFVFGFGLFCVPWLVGWILGSAEQTVAVFFAAVFVVINVMEHALVLDLIGEAIAAVLRLPAEAASGVLLASAAVASSVTDNIPLAAMLAKILSTQQRPETSRPMSIRAIRCRPEGPAIARGHPPSKTR